MTRPIWKELEAYLDKIINSHSESSETIESFKRVLAFESENDFFDLRSCIRDHIREFQNGNAIIHFVRDEENELKANIHKALTILEEKYLATGHSHWKQNEIVLRTLIKRGVEIFKLQVGGSIQDPSSGLIHDEALRDFHKLLWRIGVFRVQRNSLDTKIVGGTEVSLFEYLKSDSSGDEPPNKLDKPVEFEERYIQTVKTFLDYVLSTLNGINKSGGHESISTEEFLANPTKYLQGINNLGLPIGEINSDLTYYNDINQQSFNHDRQTIVNRTGEVKKRTDQLRLSLLNNSHSLVNLSTSVEGLTVETFPPIEEFTDFRFAKIAKIIADEGLVYKWLKHPSGKTILFVDFSQSLLNYLRYQMRYLNETHFLVFVSSGEKPFNIKGIEMVSYASPESLEGSLIDSMQAVATFLTS